MRLAAHGLTADLPPGWEGSIAAERLDVAPGDRAAADHATEHVLPVAHFATFALPAGRDDFGANAVELMNTSDAFVALLEYAPEEADSALFAADGMPRKLDPRAFSPRQLQRTLGGQAGLQLFFHENRRAFCLYVVLGDAGDAHRLVRQVEQVLATVRIEQRR